MDDMNPYAAPQHDLPLDGAANEEDGRSGDVWRDGKLLVMRHSAVLPDRCVRCNAPAAGERLKKKRRWGPLPSWRMESVEIDAGVCRRHRVQDKLVKIAPVSLLGAIWTSFAVAIVLNLQTGVHADFIIGAYWIAAIATASLLAFAFATVLFVHKIDDHYVWLNRIHRDYLAELPPFNEDDGRPGGGVWRDGKLLVMRHGAVLPDRCVRCNAPAAGNRLKETGQTRALRSRRSGTAEIEVGICRRHRARAKRAQIAAVALFCVIWASFAIVLIASVRASVHADFIIGAYWIAAIATVSLLAFSFAKVLSIRKIDDRYIWLRWIHPDYLAEFPPFDAPARLELKSVVPGVFSHK